jgi:N-acetylglucosamine-6-phosphate deacetylase
VGVALSDERLSCDLICDGAHVDPRVVRLAARAKGEKLVLITDRIDPPGLGSGSDFGSGALVDDGVALRLPDGRLAGSRVTLDRALRNARAMAGMQRLEAVAACTLRPARVIGVEAERGSLRRGARADFALLDDADVVRETWIAGERVYSV